MSEFLDLHGKVAVVTGAASGLGRAVARGLVREGARVVLGDIDKAGLERTARELGDAARWHRTDVARRDDVAALFRVCDEAFGPVEILATCAGIISSAPLAVMTEEEWDRVLAINTKGTFNTLRLAARHLRDGGRIVNFSTSVVGLALPGYSLYAASKAAVESFTAIFAKELRGRNICVNAIAPGPTATELFLGGKTVEMIERLTKQPPLERLGTPEDIANVVAFLVGEQGGWVNGQTLRVNGGIV